MTTGQAVYAGSITHTWLVAASSSTMAFTSIPQMEFNAVRIENIILIGGATQTYFVTSPQLITYCNDYFEGVRIHTLGGFFPSVDGLVGDNLRPLKMTSKGLDKLRSTNFTFNIVDSSGLPAAISASVTLSFWQVPKMLSTQ